MTISLMARRGQAGRASSRSLAQPQTLNGSQEDRCAAHVVEDLHGGRRDCVRTALAALVPPAYTALTECGASRTRAAAMSILRHHRRLTQPLSINNLAGCSSGDSSSLRAYPGRAATLF